MEYVEVEVDFDFEGIVLHDVKVLRCPVCQDEQITPGQLEAVKKKLRHL